MQPFEVYIPASEGSRRRDAARYLTIFVAFALVVVVAIAASSPSNVSLERADYRDDAISRATDVSVPPAEDPRVGKLFGKLIMLGFDTVIELKRSLRGISQTPDYDASAKVRFIETMLQRVVKRLGIYDLPPPREESRRASFVVAVKKARLLKHLVSKIPLQPVVANNRAARYAVLKYDLQRISADLDEVVEGLITRRFAAIEPEKSAMTRALEEIDHSKIDTATPVFHTTGWDEVDESIRQTIVKNSIQALPTTGGVFGKLPKDASGIIDEAQIAGDAPKHKAKTDVKKSVFHKEKRNFYFKGTMDSNGDLVGNLRPE